MGLTPGQKADLTPAATRPALPAAGQSAPGASAAAPGFLRGAWPARPRQGQIPSTHTGLHDNSNQHDLAEACADSDHLTVPVTWESIPGFTTTVPVICG